MRLATLSLSPTRTGFFKIPNATDIQLIESEREQQTCSLDCQLVYMRHSKLRHHTQMHNEFEQSKNKVHTLREGRMMLR